MQNTFQLSIKRAFLLKHDNVLQPQLIPFPNSSGDPYAGEQLVDAAPVPVHVVVAGPLVPAWVQAGSTLLPRATTVGKLGCNWNKTVYSANM